MKERIVWLMVIATCLSGYVLTANAEITVGESMDIRWDVKNKTKAIPFSWTPGSASCLVVMVGGEFGARKAPVTDVEWGNTSLTHVASDEEDNSYADIWYLTSLTGTSDDVTVSFGGWMGKTGEVRIGIVILHNVDQDDPFVASAVDGSGGGRLGEVADIAVTEGGILINSVEKNNSTDPIPLTGQTVLFDGGGPDGYSFTGAYRQIAESGLATETWDLDGKRFVLAVLSLNTDPTFNPAPVVNAGPDQFITLPINKVKLAAIASDKGPVDGISQGSPGGITSMYWIKDSGPGSVTYDPNNLMVDPNATFSLPGTYELRLQASDGFKDANDTMTVLVIEPQLIGHWPFDNDALDYGLNAEQSDGTLVELEEGYPKYDTDAAIGTHSISLADPNSTDPNRPHVALGAATELDFSVTDWTVSAWIKTTRSSDMIVFGNGADHSPGHRYTLRTNNGFGEIRVDDNIDSHGEQTNYRVDDGQWHFMLGKRDDNKIRMYRDGIYEGNSTLEANYDLSGTSAWPSYIGIITDARGGLEKHFRGLIDDVRVYNYALDDPAILALAAVRELLATPDAGPSNAGFRLQPNEVYTTDASIIDHGNPTGDHTYLWTCVGRPDAGSEDANAIFTSETALNTDVDFPYFGEYTLRLTVTDTAPSASQSDDVVLNLLSTTCADVPANLVGDISGPGGAALADCYMDLYDIAKFAADFMRCNDPDPLSIGCETPDLIPLP